RGPARKELVRGRGGRREGPAEPADRAAKPRRRLRRLPRHAELARAVPRSRDRPDYPFRGIIPRTRGVPRTRDGAFRRTEYKESEGRGLLQRAAAPVLSRTGTGAQRLSDQKDLGAGGSERCAPNERPESSLHHRGDGDDTS